MGIKLSDVDNNNHKKLKTLTWICRGARPNQRLGKCICGRYASFSIQLHLLRIRQSTPFEMKLINRHYKMLSKWTFRNAKTNYHFCWFCLFDNEFKSKSRNEDKINAKPLVLPDKESKKSAAYPPCLSIKSDLLFKRGFLFKFFFQQKFKYKIARLCVRLYSRWNQK